MDAPTQEERRERTTEALNRALADLLDGRREDLSASQQEAKRQLERLDQALRGQKPADERRANWHKNSGNSRKMRVRRRLHRNKSRNSNVSSSSWPSRRVACRRPKRRSDSVKRPKRLSARRKRRRHNPRRTKHGNAWRKRPANSMS